MNLVATTALSAYRLATSPLRALQSRTRAANGTAPIMVLFYHRIADQHANGWTMPCRTFEQQIEWAAQRFDIIDLEEAQRRIVQGNRKPAVVITFDDGYADNCEFALPLLLRKGLPATYFISTDHILNDVPFPHDVATGVTLRPNTPEEIKSMASAGIEIGAHTRTHADLGKIDDANLMWEEIAGSKQDVEQITGKQARYFACPFGLASNMSPLAFQVAYNAGFKGVCSAYGAYNFPVQGKSTGPFHIERIHADPEMPRFKNWLTVDPRKTSVEAYDGGDYTQPLQEIAAPVTQAPLHEEVTH